VHLHGISMLKIDSPTLQGLREVSFLFNLNFSVFFKPGDLPKNKTLSKII